MSRGCRYQELPTFPGPEALGRGLVLRPRMATPSGWESYPRVRLDRRTLERPEPALRLLHDCWLGRRRMVVELALEPDELKVRETYKEEPYRLGPLFEFPRERLFFLVWANNYDCLGERPLWRLAEVAVQRLGAARGTTADLRLPGGQEVWCDGGPRGLLDLPLVHRESLALGRLSPAPGFAAEPRGLAPDQARAVAHGAGPARVIAPAGSGKTRVLTSRLRHLLVDRRVEPDLATAVAYNRRAAEEMRERTSDFGPRVLTLHALGFAILRRRGGARLLRERQVRSLLSRLVEPPRELSKDPLAPYLEALGLVRLGLMDPEEVEACRADIPGFARAYVKYREQLRSQGAIDHDEQIYGALEVLLADPAARAWARKSCRHLLVDEFQDLTPAYVLLVRLLSAPAYQVFGVGDDDQVIYGYAGADPDYLIRFDRYFPGATGYALEVNYRCPSPIVEAAGRLLERNQRRVAKLILAAPGRTDEAQALRMERLPMEDMTRRAVDWTKVQLEELEPRQVALLARVNALLLPLQVALWQAGIPTTAPVEASVLERTGIRTALLYLRAARTPRLPTQVLLETVKRPSRKIRGRSLEVLGAQADWSAAELKRATRGWAPWEQDGLKDYLADLQALRARDARKGLRFLRQQVGLGRDMDQLDSSAPEGWGTSHLDDLQSLEQLAVLHLDPATFECWLREAVEASQAGGEGIRLSTIHRVKGMEWDAVALYGANATLMPHRLAGDREEERRVFHVAMTRARRRLLILADQAEPSPFLKELEPCRGKRLRASPGLRLVAPGGFAGEVCALADDHVMLALDTGGKLRVAYGELVEFEGSRRPLRRPRRGG